MPRVCALYKLAKDLHNGCLESFLHEIDFEVGAMEHSETIQSEQRLTVNNSR